VVIVQVSANPLDLSEAKLVLLRFTQAAKTLREMDPIYKQAMADYEAAVASYRRAAADVLRIAAALEIQPRGGPGTLSL
jgi:hypothetical protein